MTIIEFLLTFLYFFTGYSLVASFVGYHRHLRTLAGAFPVGYCIWGVSILFTTIIPIFPKDAYGFSTGSAIIVTTFITVFSALFCYKRFTTNSRIIGEFGLAFVILAALYTLFTTLNITVVSADSLSHIHPQEGLATMANVRGFNSTHAALAGFAGQDRYFFAYHTLFTVSLLLLMGEFIYNELKKATIPPTLSVGFALVGPILLASCHMTAINAFYINNHVLVANLVILSLSVIVGARNSFDDEKSENLFPFLLCVILISFLSFLRLEGVLIGLLLLLVMLGKPGMNSSIRSYSFLLFAVLTIPFLFYMIDSTSGKVSAGNFVIIIAAIISVTVLFSLKKPKFIIPIQDHAHKLAILGLLAGCTLFLIIDDGRMIRRLGWVIHNMFDESYWGFVHHTMLICIPVLLLLRFFNGKSEKNSAQKSVDSLLLFYIASLLLIVFMTKFHGARPGWSSSQNRMLLHFLPVGIIWAMIQTGLGLQRK